MAAFSLNLDEKQIYVDGEPVKLTATEYRIIELLMRNRGRVFSAEEIYERVWKEPAFATRKYSYGPYSPNPGKN